jgi:toxin CcdB
MAQFDVYENLSQSKKAIPFLLDIQHDILEHISTRVVIPLGIDKPSDTIINKQYIIKNQSYTLMTTQMSSIP